MNRWYFLIVGAIGAAFAGWWVLLLGGIGFIFWSSGETVSEWTNEHVADAGSPVSVVGYSCLGGLAIVALLVAALVGILFVSMDAMIAGEMVSR